ncbi:MAG: WG repeat-containing protein [Bacteroidota bacterium]
MKKIIPILLAFWFCQFITAQALYPVTNPQTGSSKGFIDNKGKLVIPYIYSEAYEFSDGMARCYKNGFYGFIDASGKEAIPFIYESAQSFYNGYAWVSKGGFSFFIDKANNRYDVDNVFIPDYQKPVMVTNGLVLIYVAGRKGFANLKNELVIPADYMDLSYFSDGFAVGKKDAVYYLVDPKGNETKLDYSQAMEFSSGLLAVLDKNGLWGYINPKQEVVIKPQFPYAYNFYGKYAKYYDKLTQKHGLIDHSGNKVTEAIYREIHQKGEEMLFLDYALYDNNLRLVKKMPELYYDDIGDIGFKNGLSYVHLSYNDPKSKNELIRDWGGVREAYIDKSGKIIWYGQPYYSCFPENAAVTMADFSTKAISEIQKGDEILSYNPQTQSFETNAVHLLQIHEGNYGLRKISYEPVNQSYASADNALVAGPHELLVTPNHPVLTGKGVKIAAELRPGDIVYSWNNVEYSFEAKKVLSNEASGSVDRVFNLKTGKANYIVNGMVVLMK